MGRRSPDSGRPARIGVIIGRVNDSYQRAVWRSVMRRAAEKGVEVLGMFGHGLGAPNPDQATMNIVYRMAGPDNLDALIVLSNTVGNFEGPSSVVRLIADSGLPTISIEIPLEGVPSVCARSDLAMTELIRHLAREHGRRSFALVTGPERHVDSIQRELVFRRTLEAEGIVFDERLRFGGSFLKESGAEGTRRLLDQGLRFDALVCLNDYMALGAMEVLRERGVAVPTAVSVSGFDDIAEARWTSPPLTTVWQPIDRLASDALDMVIELLGGSSPESRVLDCSCVFRQSCGCPPDLPLTASALSIPEDLSPATLELMESVDAMAKRGDARGMLGILDAALTARSGDSVSLSLWRRLIYRARGGTPALADRALSNECFDQALAMIGEVELRWEVERNIKQAELYARIRELSVKLLGTFSLEALVLEWQACLEAMGIPRGLIILFEGPVEPRGTAVPPLSRLISSSPPDRGVVFREFPTARLFPPEMDFRWGTAGWIIEPLVYQDEPLGYILMECGSEDPVVYETFRQEMSTAVKGALLMEEIRENKRDLERLVAVRTRELLVANRDLKDQIEQRRTLEMEVQEISNRTMQSIGQDIHDDLCQHLVGISMLAAVMEETLASTGRISADSIREIRDLLGGAVERSRKFARTLYPPGLEELGLVSALEDLVESLGRSAPGTTLSFQMEGDCRIEDPVKALQFFRIVQEALSNALRHSGSEVVMLRLFEKDGSLVAEVRDFGRGLGDDSIGRGMGMRIMRYRAESIGARLEIRNLGPGVCVSCALE